jgi:hypothetical protein
MPFVKPTNTENPLLLRRVEFVEHIKQLRFVGMMNRHASNGMLSSAYC